jgi:CheY-like chemotaxis protein
MAEPDDGRLRVLVVEDNADARRVLALLVQAWGHAVTTAGDGPEALAVSAESPPDVVLIDLGLPGLDGYEVAHRLHERTTPKCPFVIALTGYGTAADRQRSAQAGADIHLPKPADPGVLERLLGRMGQILAEPTDLSGRQLN